MTNKEYHALTTHISNSGLSLVHKDTKKYWNKYLNPNRIEETQTPALLLGSAFHSLTLEPLKFVDEFAVLPEGIDRRSNAGKLAYAEFELKASGKGIINAETYRIIQAMKESVLGHKSAMRLLEAGVAEETFLYELDGVKCKCRPDFITVDDIIVDLKTTADASPDDFTRSITTFRYHVQNAFYVDGVKAVTDKELKFCFIAVEKTEPYDVAVYYLNSQAVDKGREIYLKDLAIYKECLESGIWFTDNIMELNLPQWAYNQ